MPWVEGQAVEARLQFWDSAYKILGVVRSAAEEVYRQGLWRCVEDTRQEQKPLNHYGGPMRTCFAVVQFALRHAQSDLRDTKVHLRDAIFNPGCFGITDAKARYRAERYEYRKLPLWCWNYDRNERGLNGTPRILGLFMPIGTWIRNA